MSNTVCIIGSNAYWSRSVIILIPRMDSLWCLPYAHNPSVWQKPTRSYISFPILMSPKAKISRHSAPNYRDCSEVIHNAGILCGDTVDNAHDEEILTQFTVNTLNH